MDELIEYLRSNHLTISTAESCTGGYIAHLLTLQAGSSDYYRGTVVSYANEVKTNVLDVCEATLRTHGAVSEPVVRQMAEGVRKLMQTSIAIATSGIAGPGGGTAEKPVGTVWIAVASATATIAECFHFDGSRQEVIEAAAKKALSLVQARATTHD